MPAKKKAKKQKEGTKKPSKRKKPNAVKQKAVQEVATAMKPEKGEQAKEKKEITSSAKHIPLHEIGAAFLAAAKAKYMTAKKSKEPKKSRFAPARHHFRRGVHDYEYDPDEPLDTRKPKGVFLNPFKARKYHSEEALGNIYNLANADESFAVHPLKLETGRPRTRFSFIGQRKHRDVVPVHESKWVQSNVLRKSRDHVRFPSDPNLWLPVHRIDKLYYKDDKTNKNFCGKFYFVEPQSQVMMHLGRTAIFGSKLAAWINLWSFCLRMREKYEDTEKWKKFFGELAGSGVFVHLLSKSWSGAFADILVRAWALPPTPRWRNDVGLGYYMSLYPNEQTAIAINNVPEIKNALYPCFAPKRENPVIKYGTHDYLDQPLCRLASLLRKYGFLWLDTIIFQHELGSRRAVTEILDTRSDPYSEKYFRRSPRIQIVGEPKNTGRWYGDTNNLDPFAPVPCNTVWYPEDGLFRPESLSSKTKWHRLIWQNDWHLDIY